MHVAETLQDAIRNKEEQADTEHGDQHVYAGTVLEHIERLRVDAYRIARKAEDEGDLRGALLGIRALLDIINFLARFTGEMPEAPRLAIQINQQTNILAQIDTSRLTYDERREFERLVARATVRDDSRPGQIGGAATG
jgi:hypothetical protein